MGNKYTQLTLDERYQISSLYSTGKTIREIATIMARSPSTISRELKRNKTKTKGYDPNYAHVQTRGRRWQGSRLDRQPELRHTVLNLLTMGWSPQQVAGRLAAEQGCRVISHESIYRFIYAQIKRTKDYSWRHYLPRAKSRRGRFTRKGGSSALFIKKRVSIHERPQAVLKRHQPGHWEADLMLFSRYGQAILVVQERQSRFLMLFKLDNKQAFGVACKLEKFFRCLPRELVQSITFDNGTEFAEHHRLHAMGMSTYFCDVRSPWQKGGIENAIGRLRRPLPRKTDLAKLGVDDLVHLVVLYNNTPRKCLNFKTPAEIFCKQLLHFECETTSPLSRG